MKIRKAYQGTVPENKILDTYSESQTDTYSCNYVNKAFGGTVIWANPNPTSNIQNALNITLNESDTNFDVLEVYFKVSSDGTDIDTTKTLVGNTINMSATGYEGASLRRRIARNSATSYTITAYNGESFGDSSTGKYVIPIYIIGYKTGLFS